MSGGPPNTGCESMLQELKSCAVQVYGVIGNPVSHSRSPALHNAAMRAGGMDAVYLPLLVDELQPFLHAFPDFSGFSVTIPHKVQHANGPALASYVGRGRQRACQQSVLTRLRQDQGCWCFSSYTPC